MNAQIKGGIQKICQQALDGFLKEGAMETGKIACVINTDLY